MINAGFGKPNLDIHSQNTLKIELSLFCNVADPDPDPFGSGLFGSLGSGSGKIPDPEPLSAKRPL